MRRTRAALLLAVLAACTQAAPGSTVLFFRSSPTAQLDGLNWVPDLDSGRLVALDGQLHIVKTVTSVSQPVAVSAYCGHLVVTEYTGQGVLLDTAGHVLAEWDGPFPASLYSADGCRLLASRSPYLVQPVTPDSSGSLVRELDSTGHGTTGYGTLHAGANAGAVAATAGGFYFAPLARDEIVKYSAGAVVWTSKRGLPLTTRAGIALTLGPDGRLYALGADDSTASKLRVDVLDTATGAIVLTRHLGPRETAVALDPTGVLHAFDADSIAKGAGVGGRESFAPPFALPDLHGGTVDFGHFTGKVTLVNFWASWCGPCREEFPHMSALYGRFSRKDFDIAAISDDVDPAKMRAFVAAFRPPFPILVGAGRMRAMYHYRGLPYSLLLDRRGRVVERIFGFGGEREFRELAATIAKEIAAP